MNKSLTICVKIKNTLKNGLKLKIKTHIEKSRLRILIPKVLYFEGPILRI